MPSSPHPGDVIHFGPFEVNLQQGVIRKDGEKVRLPTQPFLILAALLEEPGAVVSREELRRRLWPGDEFVDFEHGLNTAVGRLRQALEDSAETPRYVERLAKRGYRFVADVQRKPPAIEQPPHPGDAPAAAAKPKILRWITASLILSVAVGGVTFLFVSAPAVPPVPRPIPLTAFRGLEINPALSPDGNQVAFAWNGEKQDNFDIYVMPVGSAAPVRLTRDPGMDLSPAWSPDGRTIAFIRRLGKPDVGELLLIPASGGLEHKVREIRSQEIFFSPRGGLTLSWLPDGQSIAVSHQALEDASDNTYLVARTGEMRRLNPRSGQPGDGTPSFSPDGRSLAFSRPTGFSTSEIFVQTLDRMHQPVGEARRLTDHKRWSANPAWTVTGHHLLYVFGDHPMARTELRAVDISAPQTPARTIPLDGEPRDISVGRHLVYSRHFDDLDIWRARLPGPGMSPAAPERFISSTRLDSKPAYSNDGRKIAFVSSRSGTDEIWASKSDGSEAVRLSSFGGPLIGTLHWTPDDQRIVFHARPEGQADIFTIPAAGGVHTPLTKSSWDETLVTLSRDGRWLYFNSMRSDIVQIWRMPAKGGEATQLTTSGGILPRESVDGKTIYYYRRNTNEIWSVPSQGGKEERVVGPTQGYPTGFAVTAQGIYYPAQPHSGELRYIRFFSFATRQTTPVAVLNRPVNLGMTVSPDSKYIVFDQNDESTSDLMIVENFRPE